MHERCCPQTVLKAVDLLHISAPNCSPTTIPKGILSDCGPRVGLTVSLKPVPANADVSCDACGPGSLESRLHNSRLHDAHRRLEKQRSGASGVHNGYPRSAQVMLESDDDDEETEFKAQTTTQISKEHSAFCANRHGKRRRAELEEEAEAAGTSGMMGVLRVEDIAPSRPFRSLRHHEDQLQDEEQVCLQEIVVFHTILCDVVDVFVASCCF